MSEDKSSEEEGIEPLSLKENYYSEVDVVSCFGNASEIQLEIDKCKESILKLQEVSENKRLLVRKLVKLRLKLQEVQEIEIYLDPKRMKIVQNHKFLCQGVTQLKFHTSQIYCETCSGLIWIPVQSCFVCLECDYVSHGQCLNTVRRVCASVKAKRNLGFILDLCPENTLKNQNYRCAECKAGLLFSSAISTPILCDYSGLYFCSECHWGSLHIIPARVVSNWDFQEYPVSQASKQYLKLMMKKSILNLEAINCKLFSFIEDLALVKRYRKDLLIMKEYILSCKDASEAKLLRLLEERQHFVENSDYYSLQDLIDIHNNVMLDYLKPIYYQFLVHITIDCLKCKGKGHVCRFCGEIPVIFAFESSAIQCEECYSVYHRQCVSKKVVICPKCAKSSLSSKS